MPDPSRPSVALALYRDPALLPCVEHPGFAGRPPSVIIELSLRVGLRPLMQRPRPAPAPRLSTPLIFAPTWRRTVPSLLRLAAEAQPGATGPVILVCHTLDAHSFVDTLGRVDTTRLIWHPADAADQRLDTLITQVERSALGPSLARGGLYLSSVGRPTTAADWQRTVACRTLAGLSRVGRRGPAPVKRVPAGA